MNLGHIEKELYAQYMNLCTSIINYKEKLKDLDVVKNVFKRKLVNINFYCNFQIKVYVINLS